jgi:orotidine-5'-phosphate decarboxylase
VKPNLAFYEAFGSAGIAALERLRARVPSELPVILDAKRADIGSTTVRQAVALYDTLGAHAVTANPYLGADALEPLLARADRFVYVLCRTSNAGAAELQDLRVSGPGGEAAADARTEPLFLHVARRAAGWAGGAATVGLVVGATAPTELERVRAAVPELPFLVPGVGAQGGDEGPVLASGPVTSGPFAELPGGGLLVNVGRAIAGVAVGAEDPAEAIATAAEGWSRRLRVLA